MTAEICPNIAELREYCNDCVINREVLREIINFDIVSDMVVYVPL
jgi:hypothetical protein